MKTKLTLILFVLAITASVSGNPIRLVTMADSANYVFGVGNGYFMRRQVLGADTANPAKVKLFCDGYIAAKGVREGTDSYIRIKAITKGADFAADAAAGILFGDSAVSARIDQITSGFLKGIRREAWTFTPDEALKYIQTIMGDQTRKRGMTSATIDTMNMCYGYFEGIQQRQNVLLADTANPAKVDAYMESFFEGVNKPASDKLFLDGIRVASQLTQNVAQQPFFVAGTELRVDLDLMSAAILTAIKAEPTLIAPAKAENLYQDILRRAQASLNGPAIEKGRAFLRENAKRKDVHTTASGLQYEVIKEGTGAKPASPEDVVKVHYAGTLIDGTEFDSSYKRGEPIEFPLNRVIKGWTEGVMLMREGGKYRLYIPYELGYGERGAGGQIPPYATLIFDIELIQVTPANK